MLGVRLGLLRRGLCPSLSHYSYSPINKTCKKFTTCVKLRRDFSSFEQGRFEAVQSALNDSVQGLHKQIESLMGTLKERSKVNQEDLEKMTNKERKLREEEIQRDEILYEDLKQFHRRAKYALAEKSVDHTLEAQNSERFQALMESLNQSDQFRGVQVLTQFFGYPPLVAEKDFERLQQAYSEIDENNKRSLQEALQSISVLPGSRKSKQNIQTAGRRWGQPTQDALSLVEEEEAKKVQYRMRGQSHFSETLREGDVNFREQKAKELGEKVEESSVSLADNASELYSELVYDSNSTPELKRWFQENATEALQHEQPGGDFWALRRQLKQILESSKTSNDPDLIQFVKENNLEEILRATDEKGEEMMENMERMAAFFSQASQPPGSRVD